MIYENELDFKSKNFFKIYFLLIKYILINNSLFLISIIINSFIYFFINHRYIFLVVIEDFFFFIFFGYILILFDELGHILFCLINNLNFIFGFITYEFKFNKIKIIFKLMFYIKLINEIENKKLKFFYICGFINGNIYFLILFLIINIFKLYFLNISLYISIIIYYLANIIAKNSDLKNFFNLNKQL